MRLLVCIALATASLISSTARAEVRFSVRDGRVVIVATEASVADILTEWARVGQARIINADRLPRTVVTLDLQDVSEQQALDVLLRDTSGYMALARAVADPNASVFDRIVIMPPSVPPAVAAGPRPSNAPRATPPAAEPMPATYEQQSAIEQAAVAGDPSDEINAGPAPLVIIGATPSPSGEAKPAYTSRQMLEVVDPRTFQLPRDSPRIPAPSPPNRQP
jgi:hypothetical protein